MTDTTGTVGTCIITASGRYLDLLDPQPEQIDLFDIATGLSNQCRFVGQCPFYSVAEHCVLGMSYARQSGVVRMSSWLFHDAHEAYTGDMSLPMKLLLRQQTDVWDKICARIQFAISERFALGDDRNAVKHVDNLMLKAEKRFLFPRDCTDWHGFDVIADVRPDFRRWVPEEAFSQFMLAAEKLT